MQKPVAERKESLIRKTLIQTGICSALLTLLVSGVGHGYILDSYTEQSLEHMKKYVRERGRREEMIFTLAQENHAVFRKKFKDRFKTQTPNRSNKKFNRLFMRFPDGVTRTRPEFVNDISDIGVYIGKDTDIKPFAKNNILILYNLLQELGPVWHARFQNTYVTLPDNVILVYWPENSDWTQVADENLHMPDEEYVWIANQKHNPERKTVWTGLFYDEVSHYWMVSCETPLYIGNKHIATVGHDIILNELMDRTVNDHFDGAINMIFREDGRLIAHPAKIGIIKENDGYYNILESDDESLKRIYWLVKNMKPGQVLTENSVDEGYLAVSRLEVPGWYFVTFYPKSTLLKDAYQIARIIVIAGFACLVLNFAIIYYIFQHKISKPLHHFIKITGLIEKGDFEIELDVERKDELGRLAESFANMVREIQYRELRLQLLLDGSKKMSSTRYRYHALLYAAHTILNGFSLGEEVQSYIYHPTKQRNDKNEYVRLKLESTLHEKGHSLPSEEKIKNLLSLTKLSAEWEHMLSAKKMICKIENQTLYAPVFNQGELLCLFEITGLQKDAPENAIKNFVNVLCHSLSIALDNININEHLEEKVKERTQKLQGALTDIQSLKTQQDGDYFLTALLIKPLTTLRIQSKQIEIQSLVKQKTSFQFRRWKAEIGGDMCLAHSIRLNGKPVTVFVNADAMGKSIQGAGGTLVLGSVFNSIIERTRLFPELHSSNPSEWMRNVFIEMHEIFLCFEGSMLMSLVLGLIDEQEGLLYHLNAEHPEMVLCRDGKAVWFPHEQILRKLGSQIMEPEINIETFQLQDNDILISGSDGRDDILLPGENGRGAVLNEDETRFLNCVAQHGPDLEKIYESILSDGHLTDDLSLLRVKYSA